MLLTFCPARVCGLRWGSAGRQDARGWAMMAATGEHGMGDRRGGRHGRVSKRVHVGVGAGVAPRLGGWPTILGWRAFPRLGGAHGDLGKAGRASGGRRAWAYQAGTGTRRRRNAVRGQGSRARVQRASGRRTAAGRRGHSGTGTGRRRIAVRGHEGGQRAGGAGRQQAVERAVTARRRNAVRGQGRRASERAAGTWARHGQGWPPARRRARARRGWQKASCRGLV